MIKRIASTAGFAGLLAALLLTLLQSFWVAPLILQAETYEKSEPAAVEVHEHAALAVPDIEDRHHMGVGELGHRLGLADQRGRQRPPAGRVAQHLHRDLAVQIRVVRRIHVAHRPVADVLKDHVTTGPKRLAPGGRPRRRDLEPIAPGLLPVIHVHAPEVRHRSFSSRRTGLRTPRCLHVCRIFHY